MHVHGICTSSRVTHAASEASVAAQCACTNAQGHTECMSTSRRVQHGESGQKARGAPAAAVARYHVAPLRLRLRPCLARAAMQPPTPHRRES